MRESGVMDCSWTGEAGSVDFAYQAIVSTSTLQSHGFEALARPDPIRFPGIIDLLDGASEAGALREVERILIRNAIRKFATSDQVEATKLFCNVDNRTYDGAPMDRARLVDLIDNSGLPASKLCIEISELQPVNSYDNLKATMDTLQAHDTGIAIDDFGIGNSGLHMLLRLEPTYVKVDQFFIIGLASDTRKQAIVAKLCGLAHAMGFRTVAEGVENESDFRMARDLGCDLAQGFHIAPPTRDIGKLASSYERAMPASHTPRISPRVRQFIIELEPLRLDQPLRAAVDAFRSQPNLRLLPIVNDEGFVQGAIFEEELRKMMLSDFGRSLLANKGMTTSVEKFLRRCPVAEATSTVEAIINGYVASESSQGLLLINDGKFVGYLSNNSVLRLAAETEIRMAREQNPLTKLPGNHGIENHWRSLAKSGDPRTVAFFDFNHFKAFNDSYGFALGDRALLMFADHLRRAMHSHEAFVGHIGGDDFLLSLRETGAEAEEIVRGLQERFARDVESLYCSEDRHQGGITAIDRFGVARFFPLLTVTAGVLHLPADKTGYSVHQMMERMNAAKAAAKRSETGYAALDMEMRDASEPTVPACTKAA